MSFDPSKLVPPGFAEKAAEVERAEDEFVRRNGPLPDLDRLTASPPDPDLDLSGAYRVWRMKLQLEEAFYHWRWPTGPDDVTPEADEPITVGAR